MQTLTVSVKRASKIINCTSEGVKVCNGRCCNTKGFYPPKSNPNGSNICSFLTQCGCILGNEKPIKCLLYPFAVHKNSLGLYGRVLCITCKANYNVGNKTIIETQRNNLSLVFGSVVETMIQSILSGKNFTFMPTKEFWLSLEIENLLEKQNVVPIKRNEYQKFAVDNNINVIYMEKLC